jgi:rubredoxin
MFQELLPKQDVKERCRTCGKEKREVESVWLSKEYKKMNDTQMEFWETYPSGWELVTSSKKRLVRDHYETSFALDPHWLCPECKQHDLSDYFKVFYLLECFSQELNSLNTNHG